MTMSPPSVCCGRPTFINLLFSLLLIRDAFLVSAQSSCDSPRTFSAPRSWNQARIEDFNSLTLDDINNLCQQGSFSSSNLPSGRWFSYIPSSNTISRLQVEQAAESGGTLSLPNMLSLKGPCESLTCLHDASNTIDFEDVQAGSEYFIYVFRNSQDSGRSPFTLTLEYISPPSNDNMESAVAITDQNLPFQEQYTTYGALSDSSQDACGLLGKYGIWFSYSTTLSVQTLLLQVKTATQYDNIGIQYQVGDGSFGCVATAGASVSTIEWTANGNVQYYILVAVTAPDYGHIFQLTLQATSVSPAPTPATTGIPAPQTPVPTFPVGSPIPSSAAPGQNQVSSSPSPSPLPTILQESSLQPTSNDRADAPTSIPTGLNTNPSGESLPPSSSQSFPSPSAVSGTQLFLGTMLFFLFLA